MCFFKSKFHLVKYGFEKFKIKRRNRYYFIHYCDSCNVFIIKREPHYFLNLNSDCKCRNENNFLVEKLDKIYRVFKVK